MVSHERPCASAVLRSCARPSRNSVMLLGDACQPSPRVTTRRNAAGLAPPTQIGGWGFWTGLDRAIRGRRRDRRAGRAADLLRPEGRRHGPVDRRLLDALARYGGVVGRFELRALRRRKS